jgi:hypothetical protein
MYLFMFSKGYFECQQDISFKLMVNFCGMLNTRSEQKKLKN